MSMPSEIEFLGATVYMIMVFVENRSAMLQENVKADYFLKFKWLNLVHHCSLTRKKSQEHIQTNLNHF